MKTLFIGYIWPEPQSSAAGLRAMSLIRTFQEAGWEIHFASPGKRGPASEVLEALGVKTASIQPNDPTFDPWITELAPELVVFERFMMEEQFGWRVQQHCPDALRVLDTSDLHFLRRARQKQIAPELSEDALREIACIYRSDCTLIISDHEMKLLTNPTENFHIPSSLLFEWGYAYDSPSENKDSASLEKDRSGFAFIGNFRHEPNADAVRWLKQELWPLIRQKLPEARLSVYGAYPSRAFMDLHDEKSGFLMKGFVQDQYAALSQHLVNLAPLRFGAGLKGKITDGWWSGTPCVSTPIGAEGLFASNGEFGGLVAERAEEFAQAACTLMSDSALRAKTRLSGWRILRERFDHATQARRLTQHLLTLRDSLPSHRAKNLVGRMLTHHLFQSTKYFSRWIELKEKSQVR